MNDTALLLAAGFGSRISDVTLDPKSFLEINNNKLIDWHFAAFKEVGIKNVVIVTGYKKDLFESYVLKFSDEFNITFATNEDYKVKGNTYSLLFGLEKIHSSFYLFDADLIYEPNILKQFMLDSNPNQILVGDSSIEDIECAKCMVDQTGFARMTIDKRAVSKEELLKYNFSGEAIGILKFSKEYKNDLYQLCKKFLANSENISKNWEHVLNEFLVNHEMTIHKTNSERWVEIDNKEDLEKARKIFQ